MIKAWPLLIILAWLFSTTVPNSTVLAEEDGQIVERLDGRKLREKREQDITQLEQHQATVRALEAIGYALKYQSNETKPTRETIVFNSPAGSYIRNSLSERLVVPVVEIRPYDRLLSSFTISQVNFLRDQSKGRETKQDELELTVEMLLPFTNLRTIDLSHSKFSLKEIGELQAFPDLKLIVLSEKLLEPETKEKIQAMLPRCELRSEEETYFSFGSFQR